ncbi:hypothetical protein CPB86DRAFT_813314 [Serendipita vermifera]|nr:hypothetical protein CPB86DRAFT_813314 [Serendipita vermifera]
MSSSSTAFDVLTDIPPCKGLTEIYDGASQSLDIINLWKQASTDNAQLQEVINKVQGHSVIYFDALDTSITTAKDGLVLSIEIIDICPFLLKKDTDPEDLKESLSEIREKAKKAHSDSKYTLEKFRSVREDLFKIISTLPKDPTDKETSRVVKFFSKHWPFGMSRRGIQESSRGIEVIGGDFGKTPKISTNSAIDKALDLKPTSDGVNSIQVGQMRNTWERIRDDYQQYRNQIMKLQDRYPSRIEGAKEV